MNQRIVAAINTPTYIIYQPCKVVVCLIKDRYNFIFNLLFHFLQESYHRLLESRYRLYITPHQNRKYLHGTLMICSMRLTGTINSIYSFKSRGNALEYKYDTVTMHLYYMVNRILLIFSKASKDSCPSHY